MDEIQTRKLQKCDAAIYQKIRLKMLKEEPLSFGSSYVDTKKEPLEFFEERIEKGNIFAAFDQEDLVGTAEYYIHEGEKVAHKAGIWGVYVAPIYRGKRLSQKLVQSAVNEASPLVEQIIIHVSGDNQAAIKIYEDVGFKEFGREPNARKTNGAYFDEVSMVKFT